MHRNVRRASFALVVVAGAALLVVDTYLDKHPEVLKKFMAEHPALFPDMPWWAYGLAILTVIAVAYIFALPFKAERKTSRRRHNNDH